jgi:FkbH-like protein
MVSRYIYGNHIFNGCRQLSAGLECFWQMVNSKNKSFINIPPEKDLSPHLYAKIFKTVKEKSSNLKKIKIAIIATFTVDVIEKIFFVELARRGICGEIKFLPFNQFEQEIFQDNSTLYNFKPDVIILLTLVEDVSSDNIGLVSKKYINRFLKRFKDWIHVIRKNCNAAIISSTLELSNYHPKNLYDAYDLDSIDFAISKANSKIAAICNKFSDCFLMDYKKIVLNIGLKDLVDKKLYYLGKISHSYTAQVILSKSLSRIISAYVFEAKKCIVVDADNTLWGGVIGEEGINGIALSDTFPGNIFKEFQKYLLRLRHKGVILALASKNNFNDIENVFNNHTDCVLKLEYFTAIRVNWDDKATNIKEIAEEINIGTDSMVFVDDNPIEREWVEKKIPEVLIPDLPKDPINFIECIEDLEAFDFLNLSMEDKMRSQMYGNEQKRKKEKLKSASLDDFLKGLKMRACIEEINSSNLNRVVQLLNKTNQFNLTVRRYNESQVKELIQEGALGITLRLSDKYGDSGLVGLSIVKPYNQKDVWLIDSFLLSCRVLGRKVEDFLLSHVVNEVKKKCNSKKIKIIGEFVLEKKNLQVENFFPKRGFKRMNSLKNKWVIDTSKDDIPKPKFITLD